VLDSLIEEPPPVRAFRIVQGVVVEDKIRVG
jgi:hypothetical protein